MDARDRRVILIEFQHIIHDHSEGNYGNLYEYADAMAAKCLNCRSSKAVAINTATNIYEQLEDLAGKHAALFEHTQDTEGPFYLLDARVQWAGVDSPSPDFGQLDNADILQQVELIEKRGCVDKIVVKFTSL